MLIQDQTLSKIYMQDVQNLRYIESYEKDSFLSHNIKILQNRANSFTYKYLHVYQFQVQMEGLARSSMYIQVRKCLRSCKNKFIGHHTFPAENPGKPRICPEKPGKFRF